MKNILALPVTLIATLSILAGSLTSCTNPDTGKVSAVTTAERATPFVRPASAAIGIGFIAVAPDKEEKTSRAKWLFAAATVIRTVSSQAAPTETEFKDALAAITPEKESDWLQVVAGLSSLYRSFKARFGSNTATVLLCIEQIALGLEDAVQPYISAK